MKKLILLLVLVSVTFTSWAQTKETVAILGDSYSTYEGYIPTGNEIWYFQPQRDDRTDVNDVKQTWWWKVVKEGGFKLGVNDSYSGATICYTGYRDEDYTKRSFVQRLANLGTPDIIFVFGGTNDSWAGAPLGEFKYNDIKHADLFCFRPAMAYMLQGLLDHYPNTKIYVLINDGLSKDVTEAMKVISKHYSVPTIELNGIDKKGGHPTIKGMEQIKQQVLSHIR